MSNLTIQKNQEKYACGSHSKMKLLEQLQHMKALPSKETIELLEDSELIKFNIEKIKELTLTDLSISHLMNGIIIEHTLYLEERLYQLQFMTSKNAIKYFMNRLPKYFKKSPLLTSHHI